MPGSWKCSACGLVNFATDTNCKRCDAANVVTTAQPATSAGIVLEDGYVLPPPPAAGIWRDNQTLVVDKFAVLPDYCVKCNAPTNGLRVRKKLSWHHPAVYLVILLNLLIYAILSMAISKRATVEFPLCEEHKKRRRTLITIGFALLAVGLILPFVGLAFEYSEVGFLGLLVFLVAIVWLVMATKVVGLKKIDDRYVWLTNVNQDFLARFPSLPG